MGKGNRSRIERAMNDSAVAEKKVQAKKNKVSGAGIFVGVAAILVVIALLFGVIGVMNDSGWFARSKTVVKVEAENGEVFKVDGAMMNYFFTTQFNNYYQYFYSMYSQLASSTDVSSYVYTAMGIKDPSKSLKEQEYSGTTEDGEKVTVFEYYMDLTEDYVARMLTYCKFATEQGIELTDEDIADIEGSIDSMKESYKSQKALYEQFGMSYYANFSAYLSANYGTGVRERDIVNCLEMITLAAKFEEQLTDEKKQEILGDKANTAVEEYVKDNPSAFLMADYYSYSFTVNNKGMTDAEFEAEKADLLEQAKALAAATDKEAYKAAVLALLEEAELNSYREKNLATYLKANDNDEEKAEKALKEAFYEKVWTEEIKNDKFEATLTEGYKYPTTHTDLSKWVFGFDAVDCEEGNCSHKEGEEHDKDVEAAKKGDLTYLESTTEKEETVKKEETTTAATTEETTTDAASPASEETTAEETTAEETTTKAPTSSSTTEKVKVTTYTVTVYLLEKETYRNTEITKNFGYVMFASKADAEKFYEEYKKGEMNKDTLVDLIEEMQDEVTPYAYDAAEDYLPGDLQDQKVSKADEWLENAKAGDCSGVIELVHTTTSTTSDNKTEEKKTTYYSILVFDGDSYEAWYCDALVGATDTAVSDWYEENALELTFSDKAYKYINV